MINKELLINNGYRPFKPCSMLQKYAVGAYQKAIRDEGGRLYFVHVYEYDPIGPQVGQQYTAEAQFITLDNQTFDVQLHDFHNIEQLESFYAKIWGLGCIPYDQ